MSNNKYQNAATPVVTVTAGSSTDNSGASGVGHTSGSDDVEGDEEQEESSRSAEKHTEENELKVFREQWRKELETSPQHKQTSKKQQLPENDHRLTTEDQAKTLFLKGVENEQNGKLYEAIQFYRRAVQLVPDIEFRLYDTTKSKAWDKEESLDTEEDIEVEEIQDAESETEDDDDEDDTDLLSRLRRLFSRPRNICVPQHQQTLTHISALPVEIILQIFKWVVSSDLDLRSLEMCSRVCRGFYFCSRDQEIWKLACIRVWGVNCGGLTNYESWRQMFLERPRLHFNGCYISKTTYIRSGENSFQDQFYRPWHLVEYYRYLRFFADGLVLMLTTPDDPVLSVSQLRYKTPRNSAVLTGHYRLHEDRVIMALKRQDSNNKPVVNNRFRGRRREPMQDMGDQTFHLELQILNHRNRINVQLVWHHYSVFTRYLNGQESEMTFDLPTNRFPSFWFSRVRSYTAESESPLQ